jgi:hypothetical protein
MANGSQRGESEQGLVEKTYKTLRLFLLLAGELAKIILIPRKS